MDDIINRFANLSEQDALAAERCAWCGRPHRGMGRCLACAEESKQADAEIACTKPLLDQSDEERVRLTAEAVYSTLLEKGCPVAPAVTYAMAVVERLKRPL